jgi:hypothetical protein
MSRLVDHSNLTEEELNRLFDIYDSATRLLLSYRLILSRLENFSRLWLPGRTISFLVVNGGRGDLSRVIATWAEQRKTDVQILSIDSSARAVSLAKTHHENTPSIVFDHKELTDPVFLEAHKFDYVVSADIFYQTGTLSPALILKKTNFLARRGLVLSDWRQGSTLKIMRGVLLSLLKNENIEAELSSALKKSYSINQIKSFLKETELDYLSLNSYFGLRFILSGERGLVSQPAVKAWPLAAEPS